MSNQYRPNPRSNSFPQKAGVYLQNGQVYFRDNTTPPPNWHAIHGEPPNLIDVVIGFNDRIYALDNKGDIWAWAGASVWTKDPVANNVVSLSSDRYWYLYCVNQSGQIYIKPHPAGDWTLWDEKIPEEAGEVVAWKYTVKAGDWLWKIVRTEYNTNDPTVISGKVQEIKTLNQPPNTAGCATPWNGDWDNLCVGMVLNMPPK